jgi:hypothetical protein
MTKYFFITLCYLSMMSCRQTSSGADAKTIKELRQRVDALEQEVKEIKARAQSKMTNEKNEKAQNASGYFTIGSTEAEVIRVMGDPSNYYDFGAAGKRFQYGLGFVSFRKGKVDGYNNADGNLKIRVRP